MFAVEVSEAGGETGDPQDEAHFVPLWRSNLQFQMQGGGGGGQILVLSMFANFHPPPCRSYSSWIVSTYRVWDRQNAMHAIREDPIITLVPNLGRGGLC